MDFIWPNREPAEITDAQRGKLEAIAVRYKLTNPVCLNRGFGGEYVLVDVGGMVIGVEKDGYAHT